MNKGLLGLWLVLPLGAWAYHEGPGQVRLRLDEVDRLTDAGHAAATAESWPEAVELYEAALEELPADHRDAEWRIRLELDKARMLAAKLPDAHGDLESLVDEMAAHPDADPVLLDEVRSTLASSQYYLTWLMRLEGLPEEEWRPEIEAARQTYRLLAEHAERRGDTATKAKNQEDLEAAIRLARMDLTDLQGLPLPDQ